MGRIIVSVTSPANSPAKISPFEHKITTKRLSLFWWKRRGRRSVVRLVVRLDNGYCLSYGFCLLSWDIQKRFAGILGVILPCHIRVNVAGHMTVAVWCQCRQRLCKFRRWKDFRGRYCLSLYEDRKVSSIHALGIRPGIPLFQRVRRSFNAVNQSQSAHQGQ
jgi:hypothetical protein